MRTLVTGGAGFIGSALCEHLLDSGDEVVVLDDLSTGSLDNLSGVIEDPRLSFVHGSVLERDVLDSVMARAGRVFHLAAVVGVRLIVDHPLHGLRVNIHGTENVLEAARTHGVRVLLASTSEVYGKNTADRLSEDSDRILGSALLSRWTYAGAKGIDEAFAHAYATEYGVPLVIVRLFNTVGPRQTGRYGMVVPNLIGQALAGEPLTVFGDGQQTRCFSYVADVVPAMVALAECPAADKLAVNLGGLTEISIMDLARRIVSRLDSPSEIRLIPYSEAYGPGYEDMRRRVPDNTLAGRLVGFHPRTTIEEIIDRVAASMAAPVTSGSAGTHR
ncbi:NAD-dependent epimerase/dehydratase family protein [Pseudonocardia lutea]|uniref:NAD-dependent epimerase/dehydratase family protein n=1 Tax=Pseudonocardia lutea TaxID=2172015 RepID=A0ABW1I4B7_9PSEU